MSDKPVVYESRTFIAQSAHRSIQEMEGEIVRLRERLASVGDGKIQGLASYRLLQGSFCRSDWEWRHKTPDQALEDLEAAYLADQEIRAANAVAIEANKRVHMGIVAYLRSAGLPDEVDRRKPRGTRLERVRAPWLVEIDARIPRVDPWDRAEGVYKRAKAEAEKWRIEIDNAVTARQRVLARERAQRGRIAVMGAMAVKYGLPASASDWEVREAILSRSSRLRFAHSLIQNRNDWSDGPDYARDGLRTFEPITEADTVIAVEVEELVDGWDGDGRVFRDAYETLFAAVGEEDPELLEDYWVACGDVEDEGDA